MSVAPDFQTFATVYESGQPQVLWSTLVADLETPVSTMLKLANERPYSFLLESVEGGAVRGRYSIIGLKPDLIWRYADGVAAINAQARYEPDAPEAYEPCPDGPLESLRRLMAECRIDLPEHLPPMASGLVGYMSYDTIRLVERIPDTNPEALGLPEAQFIRPTIMAIFDSVLDLVTVVTPVWPDAGMGARAAYNLAAERLADVVTDLERPLAYRHETGQDLAALPEPGSNTSRAEYHEMVRQAKDYIAAGDIFQVVLSHRFEVPFELPAFALYRALRRTNPSPFMFFLNYGSFSIVGSSPEILVRLRDDQVTIRPIAGTRPRGANPAEDAANAEDLLADPKELAEHLMLLDLGRNDVGRVAEIGSVSVTEQMKIEYYSHVMHIVSNVEGRIAKGQDALDALFAGFPAGTVSGAPKVRAMEIIDELEKERRGVYAGAVGYFSANGTMDSCIALRTAVVTGGKMYVQAGGGIVADSDPEMEYQETCHKSRALVRAAEEAVRFATGAGRGQ